MSQRILNAIVISLALLLAMSCTPPGRGVAVSGSLFANESFAVYPDSVVVFADTAVYAVPQISSVNDNTLSYFSEQPIVDYLFEASVNGIEAFMASGGDKLDSLPTSALAFAASLGVAMVNPEKMISVLRSRVDKSGRIAQMSVLPWPIAPDRISWILAAWEVYKATGNRRWLAEAYSVAERTLADDMVVLWNSKRGLFRGTASSPDIDNRALSATWATNINLYESYSLSTNVMYYKALVAISRMASVLGRRSESTTDMARRLAESINELMWQPTHSRFCAGLYGSLLYDLASPLTDNFGQALALESRIPTPEMAQDLIEHTPVTVDGIPPIWPLDARRDDKLFGPFTQSYWLWGVARWRSTAHLDVAMSALLMQTMAKCRPTQKHPIDDFGMAVANLSTVIRVVAGIELDDDQLRFAPVVPQSLGGTKHLRSLRYRDAELDIRIHGTGDIIARFEIDGVSESSNSVSQHLKGRHTIDITMANNRSESSAVKFAEPQYLFPEPKVEWRNGENVGGVVTDFDSHYAPQLFVDDSFCCEIETAEFEFSRVDSLCVASVVPTENMQPMGFSSPPHIVIPKGFARFYEASSIAKGRTKLLAQKDSVKFYAEMSEKLNRSLKFHVAVGWGRQGRYVMELLYTKGPDLWGGPEKCTMRTLFVNGQRCGVFVMPQTSGRDWTKANFSNMVPLELKAGRNAISIDLIEPFNTLRGRDPNTILLRGMRLIKLGKL